MSGTEIDWAGRTDRGRLRENNEDALAVASIGPGSAEALEFAGRVGGAPGRGLFFAVSDGVGGQNAGEVASALAVAGVPDELSRFDDASRHLPSRECGRRLELAVRRTNGRIRQEAAGDPGKRDMAATLSCLWLLGHRGFFAQVGDSRLYRWRAGELRQLSHDQSEVGRAVRAGRISESEGKLTTGRNLLDQALGMREETLNPEIDWFEPLPGDVFLLCSDGLVDRLQDHDLAETLHTSLPQANGDLSAAAEALMRRAEESQSRDNVTALLIRVAGVPHAMPLSAIRASEPVPPAVGAASGSGPRPRISWRPLLLAALVGAAVGGAAGYFISARLAEGSSRNAPTAAPAGEAPGDP